MTESPTGSVGERAFETLNFLVEELNQKEPADAQAKLKAIVTTLHKVISNIETNPMEPKYRRLPLHAESVKNKILAYKNTFKFMQISGFILSQTHLELKHFDPVTLQAMTGALNQFVASLGGRVNDPNAFNPYQASVTSN